MRTNGNNAAATITPSTGGRPAPALRNHSNGNTPAPSSDLKPAAKLKLDARLESIRAVIESQPTAIHTTISDTALAMLLATKTLRDKRAEFVNLTMNETLIPKSCNIQAKLVFPKEMKDNEKTKQNVQTWDDLVKKTSEELNKSSIKATERSNFSKQNALNFSTNASSSSLTDSPHGTTSSKERRTHLSRRTPTAPPAYSVNTKA
jgi:hypothetical protein